MLIKLLATSYLVALLIIIATAITMVVCDVVPALNKYSIKIDKFFYIIGATMGILGVFIFVSLIVFGIIEIWK